MVIEFLSCSFKCRFSHSIGNKVEKGSILKDGIYSVGGFAMENLCVEKNLAGQPDRSLSCPKYFYLCRSECKSDFVSCGDKCQVLGFYCEK